MDTISLEGVFFVAREPTSLAESSLYVLGLSHWFACPTSLFGLGDFPSRYSVADVMDSETRDVV